MKLSTFDAFKKLNTDECICLDDAQLARLQRLLLSILQDILSICEECGIFYTLGGGSVLGAVRHKGFIPWDDDIDLNMPRAEYMRFVPEFRRRFREKYWLHTPEETEGYEVLFARVRLKGTSVKTRDDFFSEECGAFIDIFIVENTFDSWLLRTVHGLGAQGLGLALSCRKFFRARKALMRLAGQDKALRCAFRVKIGLGFCLAFFSVDIWRKLANGWNRMCRNGQSRYVTVPAGRKKFWGELCAREELCASEWGSFEGLKCRIPAGSDSYLKRLYGDYHQIPKKAEQEKHIVFVPFEIP